MIPRQQFSNQIWVNTYSNLSITHICVIIALGEFTAKGLIIVETLHCERVKKDQMTERQVVDQICDLYSTYWYSVL
jgi:hypothetical protein